MKSEVMRRLRKQSLRDLERLLNELASRMGIPLIVVISPDPNRKCHGEIDFERGILFIYDSEPKEIIMTFVHEVVEFRYHKQIQIYQAIINGLIGVINNLVNAYKEECIQNQVKDFKILARFLREYLNFDEEF